MGDHEKSKAQKEAAKAANKQKQNAANLARELKKVDKVLAARQENRKRVPHQQENRGHLGKEKLVEPRVHRPKYVGGAVE